MNGIEALWANSAAQAIAWALIHFLWQGALAGLAAAGALTLLGKGKASIRYNVALGALLVLLACPIVTALRIAGPVGDTEEITAGLVPAARVEEPTATLLAPAPLAEPLTIREVLPSALPWVFGLWLAGVAALSVYHLGGWRLTRSLRHRGKGPNKETDSRR